jgi:hypothetical protein
MISAYIPPRQICLEEPCLSWTGRVCGHSIIYGPGSCAYDDPVRFEQREQRLYRKKMFGSTPNQSNEKDLEHLKNPINCFQLAPFVQNIRRSSRYDKSSFEFFYYYMQEERDLKFFNFKSQILRKFKNS